jgi:hypothetical protein
MQTVGWYKNNLGVFFNSRMILINNNNNNNDNKLIVS